MIEQDGGGSIVTRLSGWGRFPVESCRLYRPEKPGSLPLILALPDTSAIARGLGRSYGDAALNRERTVISFARLNRFRSFDPASAVLDCEAGVSFEEILRYFLPRGYFLPVTPGTKFVTLGGAIASDVHGKNHHRVGTLSRFVLDFRLLTARGEILTCSREENREIFGATVGGMGLTGLILSARIRLQPVETAYVLVDYHKAGSLDEALESMEETDHLYEYSVAWIDCLARGGLLGRSVLMRGNRALRGDLPASISDPLALPGRIKVSVPVALPSWFLNRGTVEAFNSVFYRKHSNRQGRLVDFDTYFYPLDSIHDWNRLYGSRGFVQYQIVLPSSSSRTGLIQILESFRSSGRVSFLAVLKRFGDPDEGLLSFPLNGYTLTLDVPVQDGIVPFLREMDQVVVRYGGRIYLAKDAVTNSEAFGEMYPNAEKFRRIQRDVDPDRRLSSSLARRVGLVSS